MNIKTLPRNIINLNLKAARLPWTVVERATTRDELASPVSIALGSAEATVKEALGGFLNDEQLLGDARLQRAKLAKLQQAAEQKAAAARHDAVADERLEEQLSAADTRARRVEREARERKQELAQEKAEAKRRIAAQADRQKREAAAAAAAREDAIDAKQRTLDLQRLEAESKAVAAKERALAAEQRAVNLDAAAKASKRARSAR